MPASIKLPRLCLLWLTLSYVISDIACNQLILYTISNKDQGILGGQTLATRQINSDNTLLPNYDIQLRVLNAHHSSITALKHAIDLVSNPMLPSLIADNSSIIIPIVLGCPYSSQSFTTSPVLNAFHLGLLSSASTSMQLSETTAFPYFYRTVPDDSIQSKAIIELCKAFEWDAIGIIHDSNAYGMNLAVSILELSIEYKIDVNSISYQHKDITSIEAAVNSIKDLDVFIIIIISHGSNLKHIIDAFTNKNMWGYPYYYVGVDAWLDVVYTQKEDITPHVSGLIGTVPWFPGALTSDDYEGDLQVIYDTSLLSKDLISKEWLSEYTKNKSSVYDQDTPGGWSIYGWDSTYTIGHALHIFDERYSLESILNDTFNAWMVMDILNDIIIKDIQFLSATGNVSFDEKGNRKHGIYAFANVLFDGEIEYFGYFYENIYKINREDIVWPYDFVEKGLMPRSSKLIMNRVIKINPILFIIICGVIGVSSLTVLFLICSTLYFRKEAILIAGSWKLNLFVCFGCLLTYFGVLLFGINETKYDSLICNVRVWLLCISFTFIFMPLFLKTFRLERIFRSFVVQTISDYKLIVALLVCALIDIALLTGFTVIIPLQKEYKKGSTSIMDELREIQYEYSVCSADDSYFTVLYVVLGAWKAIQMLFGIYVALVVSRIGLKQLTKFDETGQQISAIILTVCVFAMMLPYLLLSNESDKINIKYGMISMCILLTCNLSLIVNILPRIRAIIYAKIKKDETILQEFEDTFEDIVLKLIKKQIRNFQLTSHRRLSIDSTTVSLKGDQHQGLSMD